MLRKLRQWAHKYEFTDRLISQYGFRTIILSVGSLAVSTAYALFNGIIALLELSLWYGALAAYYILLASMRGGIIFHHNRNRKRGHAAELSPSPEDDAAAETDRKIRAVKTYRACGAVLVFLPLCLSGAVTQMVLSQRTYNYTGVMLYVAAGYTFYKIVMSIVNLVKAHRADDPTVRAVRNINFADALVSVLALQTAMVRAFTGGTNLRPLNAVFGFAVCALTVVLGITMVIKANKTLQYWRYVM